MKISYGLCFSQRTGRENDRGARLLRLRPRLLDQVRDSLRRSCYSVRTEEVYIHWIRRFILFHDKRHPRELGVAEVTLFLSHLARVGRVSASTPNQALSAWLYVYRHVLQARLPWLDNVERAKSSRRVPTVLTVEQVQSLLARLEGSRWLMASLMYGAGLRLMECLSLRVKDLVFDRGQLAPHWAAPMRASRSVVSKPCAR